MEQYPLTEYGRNDAFHRPEEYNPAKCAYEVGEPPYYLDSHQCKRPAGHGPDGLFCRQHAAMFTPARGKE